MEKYMFLFRGGDVSKMSPEQQQAHMAKWFAWVEKLQKQNVYTSGEPLAPGGKTLSGKNKAVTDGPFTESKEVIGGFFIVEAKGYNEAVEMAKESPDFELGGSVEVRQVMKM
jgi:hypothetical protein